MGAGGRLSRQMALFRLEAKIFSREKRNRSVVAAAAYRNGGKLKDERNEKTFDYTRRSKGVVSTGIIAPDGAPHWVHNASTLWNSVERRERRCDAALCREFILAVPPEISSQEQFALTAEWAQKQLVSLGMITEVSLHHQKDGTNPHCHLLCTTRKLEGEAFGKKVREWDDVALLLKLRESWANAVNDALEKAGRPERVDHRSLKDRGIDREPQPKIGVAATAMKRKGLIEDSDRHQLVRKVKLHNEVRPLMRAIQRDGFIQHYGMSASWLDKTAFFLSRVRDQAKQVVKKAWQKLVDSRQPKGPGFER